MSKGSKTLIMCHLDGHWLPFKDETTCKAYLLRLKKDFNFDLSKVRMFNATFVETIINFEENE